MTLMEETINNFKRVYANVAVTLDRMMNFKDNYKDSITVSVTAHEIQEIRARLGLQSEDFNAYLTLLMLFTVLTFSYRFNYDDLDHNVS